jgi:hypothetical protein
MIQVFLPSSELVEPEQGKTVLPQGAENRRHTRHRFSQNLESSAATMSTRQ